MPEGHVLERPVSRQYLTARSLVYFGRLEEA